MCPRMLLQNTVAQECERSHSRPCVSFFSDHILLIDDVNPFTAMLVASSLGEKNTIKVPNLKPLSFVFFPFLMSTLKDFYENAQY